MFILKEEQTIMQQPKILKENRGKYRMECCLQTSDELNRNRRRYSQGLIESGLPKIKPRLLEGSFIGELDHPVDKNPIRQVTVQYKEASHRICEIGWSGNRLMGIVETLSTPNGQIMGNLAAVDKIPIGFSFRGMGELRQIQESDGRPAFEVMPPLHIVTWDCVSFPSHVGAQLIKITEEVNKVIHEATGIIFGEDGMIHTKEGTTYDPNIFDKLVEQNVIRLMDRYNLPKLRNKGIDY